MTSYDAMLNSLLETLGDSAAGYAYVAEECDSFGLYAYCDYQAFERRRLASVLAARIAAVASPATSRLANENAATSTIVNLRIALTHGEDAVVRQLQRNDARLAHMLQASLVDGQLTGPIAQTVRCISAAIHDAQDELSALNRGTGQLRGALAREAA